MPISLISRFTSISQFASNAVGSIKAHPAEMRWLTSVVGLTGLSQYGAFTPSLSEVLDQRGVAELITGAMVTGAVTTHMVGEKYYNLGVLLNLFQAIFPKGNPWIMTYNVFLSSALLYRAIQPRSGIELGNASQGQQKTYQNPVCNIKEMMEHLDKYVIGQKHAKEMLTQAIYLHYNQDKDAQLPKGNVLLVGPSGSGKTFMVETLSQQLNIPMATLDISKVTPEGYIGPKFTDVFRSLLHRANGNVEKANHGIIFIDEIDKQFKADSTNRDQKRFSPPGESLLNQLLCLLQGCDVSVPSLNTMGHTGVINTKNILFIFAGAFHELTSKIPQGSLTDQQLLENGVRPEFLGRLGYIAQLDPLGPAEIKKILIDGPHSVVAAWTKLFDKHGYTLVLKKSTISRLVDEALAKPTGARGMHFALRRLLSPRLAQLILEKETEKKSNENRSLAPKLIEI